MTCHRLPVRFNLLVRRALTSISIQGAAADERWNVLDNGGMFAGSTHSRVSGPPAGVDWRASWPRGTGVAAVDSVDSHGNRGWPRCGRQGSRLTIPISPTHQRHWAGPTGAEALVSGHRTIPGRDVIAPASSSARATTLDGAGAGRPAARESSAMFRWRSWNPAAYYRGWYG